MAATADPAAFEGATICDHDEASLRAARMRGGGIARWDDTNWDGKRFNGTPRNVGLRWALRGRFVGTDPSTARTAIQSAFDLWAQHAALEFAESPDVGSAQIVMDVGRIDGRGGTLAWSELPYGPDRQLKQRYDNEQWWWRDAPPQRGIHAIAVMCHEIGHALGIEHIAAGNLLAPTYSARVLEPKAGDIEQIILRYGPRIHTDSPVEPPPTDDPLVITIREPGTYRLVRQA